MLQKQEAGWWDTWGFFKSKNKDSALAEKKSKQDKFKVQRFLTRWQPEEAHKSENEQREKNMKYHIRRKNDGWLVASGLNQTCRRCEQRENNISSWNN